VVPTGRTVMVALAGANHDAARYPRPDGFDIKRQDAPHLAFGHGIHYCLGAPLARLQVTVALRGLLDRFPDLALAPTAGRDWRRTLITRGLARFPVHLGTPAPVSVAKAAAPVSGVREPASPS